MVVTQLTLTISGGGPYGLRLTTDANQRAVVDKVRKNSKANEAGLREGDVVLSINGRSCSGGDAAKATQWIDASGQKLTMQVLRESTDPLQRSTEETVAVSRAQPPQSKSDDQMVTTRSIGSSDVEPVATSTRTDFTVTAPAGVDVQQNADRSITMTIGMPFQMDIGKSSDKASQPEHDEKFSSKHNILFDNYKKEDAQQQQPQPQPQPQPQQQSPSPMLRAKRLERILSEGSGSEPSTPSSADAGQPRSGKKLFVDSAFYDDPDHKYPTVGEQIQLARQVALSVLSPANLKSKGHRMFVKRKERAIRWTTGLTDEEKAELTAQISAAKAAEAEGTTDESAAAAEGLRPPEGAPLSLPTSVMFAPKLRTEKDVDKLNAMSNEELDRMMLLERKTTHTNVSPQVCFSLVDDLRHMKGKGGKLFAKRQAKSETWDKSAGDQPTTEEDDGSTVEPGTEPDPRLAEKLQAEHRTRAAITNREPESASGAAAVAPVNRLKDMTETQKAAMTPWEAAAQYGSVEKAFEHLDSSTGRQKQSGQQSLVDSLQQQQQRMRERGRGGGGGGVGRAAVRPKSTIGCVGRTGDEAKSSDENQSKAKIEALGGNPNAAAGLASAMTSSLAAARTSAGGFRSVKQRTPMSKSGDAET